VFERVIIIVDVPRSDILGLNERVFCALSTDVKGAAAANIIVTLHVLFASGFVIEGKFKESLYPATITLFDKAD
jgi:hypothetical protein